MDRGAPPVRERSPLPPWPPRGPLSSRPLSRPDSSLRGRRSSRRGPLSISLRGPLSSRRGPPCLSLREPLSSRRSSFRLPSGLSHCWRGSEASDCPDPMPDGGRRRRGGRSATALPESLYWPDSWDWADEVVFSPASPRGLPERRRRRLGGRSGSEPDSVLCAPAGADFESPKRDVNCLVSLPRMSWPSTGNTDRKEREARTS